MTRLRRRARAAMAALLAPLLLTGARRADAVESCDAVGPAAARAWPPPLDRRVSVQGREIPLRDALDRVAAAARVRISYSADALPLDRRVCLAHESQPVGDILVALLRGVPVAPVVVAGQVVLAPTRASAANGDTASTVRAIGQLERVVVTGSAAGGAARALPYAIDVVSGDQLAARDATSMSSALDGAVPGLWLWEQSPSSLLARYGSVRGASSFGTSYPKIYLDGIEIANPLLVTHLDPQSVERIEVIRGPQGAALYGADAISGVVNIVSRRAGLDGGLPRAVLRSTAGIADSEFAAGGSVLSQSHSLALRAGTGARSAGLSLAYGTLGEFVPGAYARQLTAIGNLRLVGARGMVTGIARFYRVDAGAPMSPLLAGAIADGVSSARRAGDARAAVAGDDSLTPLVDVSQRVRQYTVGATATMERGERWTHSATAGVDGYRMRDASLLAPPSADGTQSGARSAADRATLRVSNVARVGAAEALASTITLAAEHSMVREASETVAPYAPEGSFPDPWAVGAVEEVAWRGSTGLLAQATTAWREAIFLTAGTRLEWTTASAESDLSLLPLVGASLVREVGGVAVKLRASYGKGIRDPQTTTRATTWSGVRHATPRRDLASEEQAGVEVGADLFVGRRLGLHLTRFDQVASGLIQPVVLEQHDDPRGGHGHGASPLHAPYALQNVGEISNDGWEFQGTWTEGPLRLAGALSLVESRVRRIARDYGGDLRVGDRMLEVPARTATLTAGWRARRWQTSWTLARAADWINYDRLAIAARLGAYDAPVGGLFGPALRAYWREYDGVTRLRATFSRDLARGVAFVVTGENLLDRQSGEPDNVTVLPGRTVTAGVRWKF